jgi:hypothetical protein
MFKRARILQVYSLNFSEFEEPGQLIVLNPEKGFRIDSVTLEEALFPGESLSSNSETRKESLSSKELPG